MATASKVHLAAEHKPIFSVEGLKEESADKTSELLQENHELHHIFYNDDGFHNHIVHHLLTIYVLGASPDVIQKQYDLNKSYQKSPAKLEKEVVKSMSDPSKFKSWLGDEKYYHDFLIFFQNEIEAKGPENVVNEYLFKGDERAEDLLGRLFAGFLHPLIHLGFGIEFQQPAIIAEALAQAAVHTTWMNSLLFDSEAAAKQYASSGGKSKSLVELLDEIQADDELRAAIQWNDGNKIRDGIIARAPDRMIHHVSQFNVKEEELEQRTAEMINAAIYYTATAQKSEKKVKFDFYYMHCVNSSIFFSNFLTLPWMTTATKIRLLEWKGRIDLVMYASRRSPKPLIEDIKGYEPTHPGSWESVIGRVNKFEDDGHACKLVRAIAHGKEASKKWEDSERFRIKGDMWDTIAHMVVDSVETSGPRWVRSAGFEEAWEQVPQRAML